MICFLFYVEIREKEKDMKRMRSIRKKEGDLEYKE
jgi:hypothetical protein